MELSIFGKTFSFGRKANIPKRQTQQTEYPSNWWGSKRQIVRKPVDAESLRTFAKHPICRKAIDVIKFGILSREWEIVSDKPNVMEQQAAYNTLANPCPGYDFEKLLNSIIEDMCTGDNGCAEIVPGGNPLKPFYLYPIDGFTMYFVNAWDGDPSIPRYAQKLNLFQEKYFFDEEVAYFKRTEYSNKPWGLSPVESAFGHIESLINAEEYSFDSVSVGAPKFIFAAGEDVNQTELRDFRKYLKDEVYGTGYPAVVGGRKGMGSHQIGAINDDGLYLKYQDHLISIIATAFSIPPSKAGEDVSNDRSTTAEKDATTLQEAIMPYARVIESVINRMVIKRISPNLKFRFKFEQTLDQKKVHTDIITKQYSLDGLTVNEYRELLGKPPLPKYGDMTISKYKAVLNEEHSVNGFNGSGNDRYANKPNTDNKNK